jgi:hypothetical protein
MTVCGASCKIFSSMSHTEENKGLARFIEDKALVLPDDTELNVGLEKILQEGKQ